jgi:hypothetical protein
VFANKECQRNGLIAKLAGKPISSVTICKPEARSMAGVANAVL